VIRLLGYSATLFALGIAIYGAIAAFWGVRNRRPEILASVRAAAYATLGLMLVANLAMIYGLVTHDFSISYVAQVGSRATPLLISIISLWSALEGSILFWGLVLALCAAGVAWVHRDQDGPCSPSRTVHAHRGRVLLHVDGGPREPVRRGEPGPHGRPRAQPAAPEPLADGRAPAAAVPGLRGDDRAVRVRHRGAGDAPDR
jgi:hypothetical protein